MKANPGLSRKVLYVIKDKDYKVGDIITSRKVYKHVKDAAYDKKIDLSDLKTYKSDMTSEQSLVKCCEYVLQGLAKEGILKKEIADRYALDEPGNPLRQYRVLQDTGNIPIEKIMLPNITSKERKVIVEAIELRKLLEKRNNEN